MAQVTQETNIDGKSIRVTQLPAGRGWKLFMKLSRTLFPAIAGLVGAVKSWEELDIDNTGLQKAVELLMTELEPEKSEALIKEILQLTWVDGQESVRNFDLLFQGEYLFLLKVVKYTLEVNYKSFLPEDGMAKLKGLMPASK